MTTPMKMATTARGTKITTDKAMVIIKTMVITVTMAVAEALGEAAAPVDPAATRR